MSNTTINTFSVLTRYNEIIKFIREIPFNFNVKNFNIKDINNLFRLDLSELQAQYLSVSIDHTIHEVNENGTIITAFTAIDPDGGPYMRVGADYKCKDKDLNDISFRINSIIQCSGKGIYLELEDIKIKKKEKKTNSKRKNPKISNNEKIDNLLNDIKMIRDKIFELNNLIQKSKSRGKNDLISAKNSWQKKIESKWKMIQNIINNK